MNDTGIQIKIRKLIIDVKKGDYILFNGACHQFCTGDKRELYFDGWHSHSSMVMTKTAVSKVKFDTLRKVETGNKADRTLLIYWYF